MTAMNKKESSIVIQKVNEETFDHFLRPIEKLAEYEKLPPPDQEAKRRLRTDCLSNKPKYQALIVRVYCVVCICM